MSAEILVIYFGKLTCMHEEIISAKRDKDFIE